MLFIVLVIRVLGCLKFELMNSMKINAEMYYISTQPLMKNHYGQYLKSLS
jgi:hypothetical protein